MLPISAQQLKIGYFSYDAVLKATHDYVSAKASIENLRNQYDAEIQLAQKDFNENSMKNTRISLRILMVWHPLSVRSVRVNCRVY